MSPRRVTTAVTAPSHVATAAILESISDGVFTVDEDWRITSFNRAATQITGILRQEALGHRCSEVFRASMCETECALRRTMKSGAAIVNQGGFIIDARGRRVPISVSTALLRDEHGTVVGGAETFRDLSLVEDLRGEAHVRAQVGGLVSQSTAMRPLLALLPRAAESESTLLIHGETGTGKELVARALHELSPRRGGPFVALNCGALPEPLLESELFGYRAGAFTGAIRDKPGRLSLAQRGTLFLDEIAELGASLQVKLLRVLQERRYEPLGGTRSEPFDVRVVAATHRDLDAWVASGQFRRDLYYRIKIMQLEIPPLRQRRDDIPLLAQHFVATFNAAQAKQVSGLSAEALALLVAHDFPGNVRELRNAIEHAFVFLRDGQIGLEHLPPELVPVAARTPEGSEEIRDRVRDCEARTIQRALELHQGNRLAGPRARPAKSTFFRARSGSSCRRRTGARGPARHARGDPSPARDRRAALSRPTATLSVSSPRTGMEMRQEARRTGRHSSQVNLARALLLAPFMERPAT